jgi:hypothetical protein
MVSRLAQTFIIHQEIRERKIAVGCELSKKENRVRVLKIFKEEVKPQRSG